MTTLPPVAQRLYRLEEGDLRELVDERSLSKGRSIFNSGGVSAARAQANQLMARVRDRTAKSYQVTVSVHDTSAFGICTCYNGGVCEHAAAVLVAWVAYREQFTWTPPDQQAAPLPTPAPDALWRGKRGALRRAEELLAAQRITDLRKLAQQLVELSAGDSKESLARRLAPLLAERSRVAAALGAANVAQQVALDGLLLAAHPVSSELLGRLLGAEGAAGGLESALKGLVGLGLAFTETPSAPAGSRWQVPIDWVAARVPGPLPLAQPSQHRIRRTERELTFVTALRALCLLIETDPPPLVPAPSRTQFERQNAVLNGWYNLPDEVEQLGKRSYGIFANEPVLLTMATPPLPVADEVVNGFATALKQPPAAVALMLRLLAHLKLLEPTGNKLTLSPRIELLWQRSAVEQARLLAATWADDLLWSEVHEIRGVRLRRHLQGTYAMRPEQIYTALAVMRRAVVRVVRALGPEGSFSVESLLERLQRIGPWLLFSEPTGAADRVWQLCDRHGGVLDPQQPADWRLLVVPFVQQVLRHMHILGLATVDADVTVVELTGLGAYLLGLRNEYLPAASGAVLTVSDDLVVHAAANTDAALLERLDRIAVREGFGAGSFRYRLIPEATRGALLAGWSADEVVAFLERHSSTPLPVAVGTAIRSWATTLGQVQLYGGVTLLELADDVLLTELLRSTSLSSALIAQLSPRLLLIDREQRSKLWSELVAKGYTPQRKMGDA